MNGRLLIVAVLVRVSDGLTCPNHCFCNKWKGLLRTDCRGRNLFNTFVGFSHETQVLDLSNNVLTILHGNEFLDANLRRLQDLRISNNRLHKIDKLSFNGLDFLRTLDLSFNAIEHLSSTTFIHNGSLKTLNVSNNPLRVTNEGLFLSSASLRTLDIANCQFEFLNSYMFLELIRLEILNVSCNRIQKITPEAIEGIKNLKYLDVSKNDLPCNDQTADFQKILKSKGIQFQGFCQMSEKMISVPNTHIKEEAHVEVFENRYENVSHVLKDQQNLFDDVSKFFKSIPSVYIFLSDIHVGLLSGVTVTYFCMRKTKKLSTEAVTERPVFTDNDSAQLTFALIPLNTPPGTPPSPYHSRIFTEFPLSST